MYGYANRKCGPANGTHDPLFAKVVVLAASVGALPGTGDYISLFDTNVAALESAFTAR